jgi:GNAT superfamily N-acetyltransferase
LSKQIDRFRLRPSTPDDAEAIAIIQVSSFQAGFVNLHTPESLRTLDPAPRVPLWREREALVAEDAEQVVGVIQEGPSDEEQIEEIYRLFVDPDYWGTGAAQALLSRACDQLRAAGFGEALSGFIQTTRAPAASTRKPGGGTTAQRKPGKPRPNRQTPLLPHPLALT